MDTFFTPHKIWPGGGPYPHFLILLDRYREYREFARAHADLFAAHGHLGVVPEQWLHITVQGVHHPATGEQVEALRDTARRELAGMRPFTVQLGPTWPGVTAVTAAIYPEDGMAELNRRVRAACEAVPGIVLRPKEERFWPHTALAYAKRPSSDDRALNRSLRALRPPRVEILVDRVHLVSQVQDPDLGYYTWTVTDEYALTA